MNIRFTSICLLLSVLGLTSCSDRNEIWFESENEQGEGNKKEMIHEKYRTKPYPRSVHELYLNPPPLIVPNKMNELKAGKGVQFALSQDPIFAPENTIESEHKNWGMFNVHKVLEPGVWYWRFRNGTDEWSEVNSFTVKEDLEAFVTPPYEDFERNIPQKHPRMYCFLDEDFKKLQQVIDGKKVVENHREYRELKARAQGTAEQIIATYGEDYDKAYYGAGKTGYWYQAYLLTGEQRYKDELLALAKYFEGHVVTPQYVNSNNGVATGVIGNMANIYDACYDEMTALQRSTLREGIEQIIWNYYKMYRGNLENHIFENHVMQYIMQGMVKGCLAIYEESEIAQEAMEYYYEQWTARCPAGGFNRDGGWFNGTGYFVVNFKSLCYFPMLYSHLTGTNFLEHPWYRNAGKAMMYSHIPGGGSSGFGDTSRFTPPNRQDLAFADFLARETGSSYAQWYVHAADPNRNILSGDYELRIFRMSRDHNVYDDPGLPQDDGNYVWYKDMGEGVAVSDLENLDQSTTLSFLSSPYASGSHTNPHQNSFNLAYGGRPIFVRNGYYSSGLHHGLWYNNTRSCNSMLIDGCTQGLSTKSYGNITRGLNNEHIGYFLGDASSAYSYGSDEEYKMHEEFGSDPTPLTKYRRHIFLLRPNIVVVYDDLEARSPVRWDWLLHSPTEFSIDTDACTFSTNHEALGATSDYSYKGKIRSFVQQFCNQSASISQKDTYYVEPAGDYPGKDSYKGPGDSYHLTVSYGKSAANRILTVMQLMPENADDFLPIIGSNGQYEIGGWKINANLDESASSSITISNEEKQTLFSYGDGNVTFNGKEYIRKQQRSSVLYDSVYDFQEMADRKAMSTRALGVE